MDLSNVTCPRTSRSTSSAGNCVEQADVTNAVWAVRDSKDPDGPVLLLTHTALRTAVQSAANTH